MKQDCNNIIIVIDVFRAFTTACYILARSPMRYYIATKSVNISKIASRYPNPVLIGKPEKNNDLVYHIPNSPTRTKQILIENKTILHRTEAGAKGILQALEDPCHLVFAASFVNADATVQYIKKLNIKNIQLLPMGHEATTPSLEDDICAEYIDSKLRGKELSIKKFLPTFREEAGKYFFMEDQWQYPQEDFTLCLRLNQFNFAIQALPRDDHALLKRCDIATEAYPSLKQVPTTQ